MTSATLSMQDVTQHIVNTATEEDLDTLFEAVRTRRKVLRDLRAMSVRDGAEVTLQGISPKYLNGLTGTVQPGRRGQRVDVLLDEESTDRLRYASRKIFIPAETKRHVLTGVPASTCVTQDAEDK